MMLLVERFETIANTEPQRPAFTFVDVQGRDRTHLTFGQAHTQAAAVAAFLRTQAALAPGDRVVLVYPASLDFVTALMGCMMAGVVPVPVYPPNPFKLQYDLAAFAHLVADSGARAILTNSEFNMIRQAAGVKEILQRTGAAWPDLPWHTTDRLDRAAGPFNRHPSQPDDIAFLQYTSGSTSNPKGVMITHGNIIAEVADNARAIGLGTDTVAVAWVPQYHDLCLICCIMSVLGGNGHLYLLSPLSFLERPAVWFEVMHRVRATHTCSPNFGLGLSVAKTTPAQRAAWDLRSLRVLLCGAEPIHRKTVEEFYAAFAPTGLRRETFVPAYGLAEHTVSVAYAPRSFERFDRAALATGKVRVLANTDEQANALELFSCGPIEKADCRVRIVDSDTGHALPDEHVGEIWVDSPTKAAGYLGREEESRLVFEARIAGEDDPRRYLRTGDLGFFHAGELFVAGRIKDIVIVRGRNYYPHDIELTARDAHPLVRPGAVAAFGMTDATGGEGVGMLVELIDEHATSAQAEAVAESVYRAVRKNHQVLCAAIGVGVPGTVLKTTSGKVRRGACRELVQRPAAIHDLLTLRRFEDAAASGY